MPNGTDPLKALRSDQRGREWNGVYPVQDVYKRQVLHGLAQGGFPDLLVALGQLPAQGDAALRANGGGQVVQGGACLLYTSRCV